MYYDPIKRSLGNVFNRSPWLRRLFYNLLDLLLLRTWHVHRELRQWARGRTQEALTILDAGSGYGQYSYWMSGLSAKWNILAVARVYLSLLLGNDAAERIETIRENTKEIRHALGKRIRNQARVVPELNFFHDDSAAYAAHMDQVLSKLDIPPAPPEADEDDSADEAPRPRLFNPKSDD